jgi:ribosomal-protein-alanine N-acetyltransferase
MSNISIEIALSSDAALIARLHRQWLGRAWRADSVGRLLHLPGTVAIIARERATNGRVVGFVLCLSAGDALDVAALGVAHKHRRRRVGQRLMQAVLGVAAGTGHRRVVLEVDEHNTAARALYERLGFGLISRRTGYYRGGHGGSAADALVLEKRVSGADVRVPPDPL